MRIIQIIGTVLIAAVLMSCGGESAKKAVKNVELNDEIDSVSYSIGLSIAESLKKDNMDNINPEAFIKAFFDMKEGNEYKIDQQKAKGIIQTYHQKKRNEQLSENMDRSKKYLEENKEKEGFKVAESGLQYKIVEKGDGESPEEGDRVKVHYEGTLTDGEIFDSSYERDEPAEFQVDRVIPGWTEALKKMKVGGKWEIVIPPELGYGERGAGQAIGPNEALIFEVELLDVMEGEKQDKKQQMQQKIQQQMQQQMK